MKKIYFLMFAAALILITCASKFKDREPYIVNDPIKEKTTAIIKTSMGDITIKLHWDAAPYTCLNFAKLSQKGSYNNLIFHRVISNFMIQTGDPQGTGMGGSGFKKNKFNDEINADALGLDSIRVGSNTRLYIREIKYLFRKKRDSLNTREKQIDFLNEIKRWTVKKLYQKIGYQYTKKLPSRKAVRGSLAMANSGPDSNGSQFFINVTDTPWLNGKHTVFGTVTKGLDIADKISRAKTDQVAKPLKPIKLISITLK